MYSNRKINRNRNFIFDMKNIILQNISTGKSWEKNVPPWSMKITFNMDVNKRGNSYIYTILSIKQELRNLLLTYKMKT